MHYLVTFLAKLLATLRKRSIPVDLLKKCHTTNLFQDNTEIFQSSLSEPTARACHETQFPLRIPNIQKYSGQSPLLAKL